MIFVLELPTPDRPRAWFAFDGADLQRKLDARGGVPTHEMHLWPDEASVMKAFEDTRATLWQGSGWRARWALREQLLATEVLAED